MSDLNGRANRAVEGYRAQWELAEKLHPNPYAQPGSADTTLRAFFHNVVRHDGKIVTDVTARLPNMVAVSEQQLLDGDVPKDIPKKLQDKAREMFKRAANPQSLTADTTAKRKPTLVYEREEPPSRQMAAQAEPMFNMKG